MHHLLVDGGIFNGQIKHDVKMISACHLKTLTVNAVTQQLLVLFLALALKLLGFVAAVGNNARRQALVAAQARAQICCLFCA